MFKRHSILLTIVFYWPNFIIMVSVGMFTIVLKTICVIDNSLFQSEK